MNCWPSVGLSSDSASPRLHQVGKQEPHCEPGNSTQPFCASSLHVNHSKLIPSRFPFAYLMSVVSNGVSQALNFVNWWFRIFILNLFLLISLRVILSNYLKHLFTTKFKSHLEVASHHLFKYVFNSTVT